MWVLLLVFFSCFQMDSYFVTTGWIFEIRLYDNLINQSNQSCTHGSKRDFNQPRLITCYSVCFVRVA